MLPDGLFEHLVEPMGDLLLRQRLWVFGDEVVSAGVIATAWTGHLHVEHGVVHLPHDTLGTREHRRLLVEEGQPQVNVLPFWCLVGDITEDGHDTVAFVLYEIAQDVLLGDGHAVGNA